MGENIGYIYTTHSNETSCAGSKDLLCFAYVYACVFVCVCVRVSKNLKDVTYKKSCTSY